MRKRLKKKEKTTNQQLKAKKQKDRVGRSFGMELEAALACQTPLQSHLLSNYLWYQISIFCYFNVLRFYGTSLVYLITDLQSRD